MKLIIAGLIALASTSALADKYVRGYTKHDGTYVAPHYQTESNQYRYDNYSAQGNINPYTGQEGHKPHEFTNPPAYNQSNPLYGLSPYERENKRRGW